MEKRLAGVERGGGEGSNRVYFGICANSESGCEAGGFCWGMRARKNGETEGSFRKIEHSPRSPTKVAATQAKVYMTNILFMSFAKSFTFIPRYSCHNFFRT